MAQWTKYNNPNRRRYKKRIKKNEYFPTLQELKYCSEMGITPQSHHDGTHYLLYRAWKKGVTDEQKKNVLDGLYFGTISQRAVRRYTEGIGKYIAEVYGWRVKK